METDRDMAVGAVGAAMGSVVAVVVAVVTVDDIAAANHSDDTRRTVAAAPPVVVGARKHDTAIGAVAGKQAEPHSRLDAGVGAVPVDVGVVLDGKEKTVVVAVAKNTSCRHYNAVVAVAVTTIKACWG
jgi:hypothetical protein